MKTWKTMTPRGICGSEYQAENADVAEALAKADGYDVIDVMDDVLVIPDDDTPKTYVVTATRWERGYELEIFLASNDGTRTHVGATQSHSLRDAEYMVRDYVETLTDESTEGDFVVIRLAS